MSLCKGPHTIYSTVPAICVCKHVGFQIAQVVVALVEALDEQEHTGSHPYLKAILKELKLLPFRISKVQVA